MFGLAPLDGFAKDAFHGVPVFEPGFRNAVEGVPTGGGGGAGARALRRLALHQLLHRAQLEPGILLLRQLGFVKAGADGLGQDVGFVGGGGLGKGLGYGELGGAHLGPHPLLIAPRLAPGLQLGLPHLPPEAYLGRVPVRQQLNLDVERADVRRAGQLTGGSPSSPLAPMKGHLGTIARAASPPKSPCYPNWELFPSLSTNIRIAGKISC